MQEQTNDADEWVKLVQNLESKVKNIKQRIKELAAHIEMAIKKAEAVIEKNYQNLLVSKMERVTE